MPNTNIIKIFSPKLVKCIVSEIIASSGDTFLNLLGDLKIKANEIAKEYYGYAVMNNTDSLKLKFNILLSQSLILPPPMYRNYP